MLKQFNSDYQFWMGGIHATRLAEVTDDASRLGDGNFWAVLATFEGKYHFARFKKVKVETTFTSSDSWTRLQRPWRSSLEMIDYVAYVHAIKEEIASGGVYQVNACRQLSHFMGERPQSLAPLFASILSGHPAPSASYLCIPGMEIASASPETFLKRDGSTLITSPIKGTILWNQDEFGEKDKAENLMIVDLMRNDLGQICTPGSVDVSQLFRHEKHPGITHLVSDVTGELREGVQWGEIFSSLLPPGSVSGAPKSSARSIISSHEKVDRGPYCGALGWIHGDRADLSVGIRLFWTTGDSYLRYGTGAGITWGSDGQAEWEETQLKARHLISIAGGDL